MNTFRALSTLLLATLVCQAAGLPLPGAVPRDPPKANPPGEVASSAYERELAEKLAQRKRIEARVLALEGVIPQDDWRLRLKVNVPAPSGLLHTWADELKQSSATNAYYTDLAENLRKSKVPTEDAAKSLAAGSLGLRLGANELAIVTALLRLAKPDDKLGRTGDFIWEVRLTNGGGTTGLFWVGASTGEVKTLYRP